MDIENSYAMKQKFDRFFINRIFYCKNYSTICNYASFWRKKFSVTEIEMKIYIFF
jgi:hypothetical protein